MLKSNLLLQFELTRDIILQLGGREPIKSLKRGELKRRVKVGN